MSRRPRRTHSEAFKAKVALASVLNESRPMAALEDSELELPTQTRPSDFTRAARRFR